MSPADILEQPRSAGLQPFAGEQGAIGQADAVVAARLTRTRERIIPDILLEEWSFLVGQSWIAARTKKAFAAFKRAGAVVVDFSGQKVDSIVSRTLRHGRLPGPATLTHLGRIRAAAKWIAVGGSPVAGLIDPIIAVVASAGTGVFLLFDP